MNVKQQGVIAGALAQHLAKINGDLFPAQSLPSKPTAQKGKEHRYEHRPRQVIRRSRW